MPYWWKKRKKQEQSITLAVMRESDMFVAHPDTKYDRVCSNCGERVGIYPSGQEVLRAYKNVTLICNRCVGPVNWPLAPGAELEPFASHPVKRQ